MQAMQYTPSRRALARYQGQWQDSPIKQGQRSRTTAIVSDIDPYTTACVAEFHVAPPPPPDDGSGRRTSAVSASSNTSNITNYGPHFLGWFPNTNASASTPPPRDCLQLRLGLDVNPPADSDSWSAPSDDDDDDESDTAYDAYDPKRPTPLLWLRFALQTLVPGGVARPTTTSTSTTDDELVHIALPVHAFYACRTPPPRASSPAHGPADDDDDDAASAGGITLTRYDESDTNGSGDAYQPPAYVRAAMADAGLRARDMCYIDIDLGSGVGNNNNNNNNNNSDSEHIAYPVALMPARWMRLASGVENALLRDLRRLASACRRGGSGSGSGSGAPPPLRVHAVWTRQLARVADELDARVRQLAGEEAGVALERGTEVCRLRRLEGLVVGEQAKDKKKKKMGAAVKDRDGGVVADGAWGNFVEWRKKSGQGAVQPVEVEHLLSSTVERLGLAFRVVDGEDEGEEADDEDDGGGVEVGEEPSTPPEKERKKGGKMKAEGDAVVVGDKKRKVSHGKVEGGKVLAKGTGSKGSGKK